uniref:Uncharacterized protein n=1 Tax=Anopheles christyi TaxID=43041 RepID=A0A182KI43_9DIPT
MLIGAVAVVCETAIVVVVVAVVVVEAVATVVLAAVETGASVGSCCWGTTVTVRLDFAELMCTGDALAEDARLFTMTGDDVPIATPGTTDVAPIADAKLLPSTVAIVAAEAKVALFFE